MTITVTVTIVVIIIIIIPTNNFLGGKKKSSKKLKKIGVKKKGGGKIKNSSELKKKKFKKKLVQKKYKNRGIHSTRECIFLLMFVWKPFFFSHSASDSTIPELRKKNPRCAQNKIITKNKKIH